VKRQFFLYFKTTAIRYLWFLKFKRSSTNRVETSGCLHYLAILRCDSLNFWGEMTIFKMFKQRSSAFLV